MCLKLLPELFTMFQGVDENRAGRFSTVKQIDIANGTECPNQALTLFDFHGLFELRPPLPLVNIHRLFELRPAGPTEGTRVG